jgi:hypothetical protein
MTNLSPAAQEVLDAALFEVNAECDARWIAAAVLRAIADQVVPETKEPRNQLGYELGDWDARDAVRRDIFAIATELETNS